MKAGTNAPSLVPRLLIAVLGALLVAGMVSISISTHLRRACTLLDTPYLPICDGDVDVAPEQKLRAHLATDPGDAAAWIKLTNLESGPREAALLRAAIALAPNEPNVQMWRAGQALERNELTLAAGLLVHLSAYRQQPRAAQALAQLVASGEGTALLRPYISSAMGWLPQVLTAMTAQKLPLAAALPLVAEGIRQERVSREIAGAYVQALKQDGKWVDAYALWIAQRKAPVALLHNGEFEERFESDGFDWEVTPATASRAGAVVGVAPQHNSGQMLDVRFTGRAVAMPVIRQYVFLASGDYLLQGKFMSSGLRTEEGLNWIVRCTNKKAANGVAGQSGALRDTGGKWQAFGFEIRVPADCGQVASLQLETVAAFEAMAGFKGRAYFDSMELAPRPQ